MEYVEVTGFGGGIWYYIPKEKHLFKRKDKKNGIVHLICYDSEDATKMEKSNPNFKKCAARCHLREDNGLCYRTEAPHRDHEDHEITFRDLVSLNAMKERCRYLCENFPHSAHKIPIKEIFLLEMAK